MIGKLKGTLLHAVRDYDPCRGHDSRFRSWAKRVDSVDFSKQNGFCFEGEFVPDGTVEYTPGVYLVATVTGSLMYQTTHYSVVRVKADGVEVLAPYTTDRERGWALRIRDGVAALLAERVGQEENSLAAIADQDLIRELERRGYIVKKGDELTR